jgi:predicted Holliday junction resolvase-like endonuclease
VIVSTLLNLQAAQAVFLAILVVLALLALFVLGLVLGLRLGRHGGRLEAEKDLPDLLRTERADALKRSRAVLGGQVAEQIAPFLPGFPYDPTELRFIGKPVDFIAFVGASAGRIEEVAFIEVKSGQSKLSSVERTLREAIVGGRVVWREYRISG